MKDPRPVASIVAILASWLASALVWAQAQAPPPPVSPPAGGGAGTGGGSALITAVVLIAIVLVIIGGLVKMFDLKRKREAEAVHLQAQISDALLRDQQLFGLPITPTARVPWRGSPVTVELAGQVPTEEHREAVLRIAREEASRVRPDVVIEDRVLVVPTVSRVA